jgi:hypothetical protein
MKSGDRIRWHRQYDKGFYGNPEHETIYEGTIIEIVTPDLVKVRRVDAVGPQDFLVLIADIKP